MPSAINRTFLALTMLGGIAVATGCQETEPYEAQKPAIENGSEQPMDQAPMDQTPMDQTPTERPPTERPPTGGELLDDNGQTPEGAAGDTPAGEQPATGGTNQP